MKTVWHVYIDEDDCKGLFWYRNHKDLPTTESFSKMKLFETEKGARRYMNALIRDIVDDRQHDAKINEFKAYDGGEFYKKVTWCDGMTLEVKAVARDLRR